MKQKIFNYLISKQWFVNLVRQRLNDELDIEFQMYEALQNSKDNN